MTVLDTLKQRGFIEQTTHDFELAEYLSSGKATCYIGFDPTASSLHVGSLIPIMSLAHMQRNGHRPICLVGGGTGLVGDPSGKTEMRKLLSEQMVQENTEAIKNQLSRFIDFSEGNALLLNNADWLKKLEYIPFLRDYGKYFSVNRMIKAESCRQRLESDEGLSFIEFNYMVLQAYDFLELFDKFDCRIQMGGSDQWGNIVAGIELIRRLRRKTAFGITFPLITTSSGAKMGKTAQGAVWLDQDRTSPYEYYQFWINTDDADVVRFLSLFTFLPLPEIVEVKKFSGAELNDAKTVLAYEATRLAHGNDKAWEAYQASISVFGKGKIPADLLGSSAIHEDQISETAAEIPSTRMDIEQFEKGIPAFKLFHHVGLASSGGAARRLIDQGGGYVNERRLDAFDEIITRNDICGTDEILLRAGKKRYHKIIVTQHE
jgi:tyrosyl-tRNA synthetase